MLPDYDFYFAGAERMLRRLPTSTGRSGFRFGPYRDLFAEVPQDWRSDARFFLINNMIEMVIAPYEYASRQSLLPTRDAAALVHADLRTLVKLSEEEARKRDRPYVSATSVAIALGRVADRLETTSLQIWGPE